MHWIPCRTPQRARNWSVLEISAGEWYSQSFLAIQCVRSDSLLVPTASTQHKSRNSPNDPSISRSAAQTSFRFHVVDHPNKLKDRRQLRENRQHVMRDFLTKERLRPESTDARVKGSNRVDKKRKRASDDITADTSRSNRSLAVCDGSRTAGEPDVPASTYESQPQAPLPPASTTFNGYLQSLTRKSITKSSADRGHNEALLKSRGQGQSLIATRRTPSPISSMKWRIDPFCSRHSFKDASLDTERLVSERKQSALK